MILIDGSQFLISDATTNWANSRDHFNKNDMTKTIIMKLARWVKLQKANFGNNVVMCLDSPHSWRSKIFPHYKKSRKEKRKNDSFPWEEYFEIQKSIIENLKNFVPIKTLAVDECEGDDIIAVLARKYSKREQVCIWSSDQDFLQLQRDNNIKQYSYIKKEWITTNNATLSLNEKIVMGDLGDGIPNCLSENDTFVTEGKRQVSMTAGKRLMLINNTLPEENAPTAEILDRIIENRTLIDFDKIPEGIQDRIVHEFDNCIKPAFGNFQMFLMKNKYDKLNSIIADLR